MNSFSDIESVMDDLNQRKAALDSQLKEFEHLQAEINQLVERSSRDSEAMKKLVKLTNAFPEGLDMAQGKVQSKVNEVHDHFKMLEQQFSELGETEMGQAVANSQNGEPGSKKASTVNNKGSIKNKKIRRYL